LLFLCLTSSKESLSKALTATDSSESEDYLLPVLPLLQRVLSDVCAMESSEFAFSMEEHLEATHSPLMDHFLSLRDPNGKSCLLTDSHVPSVLSHQLTVLREEFKEQLSTEGGAVCDTSLVHTLLTRLVALERAYADGVRDCKHKDIGRAAGIIPDYSARVERHVQVGAAMSGDTGKNSDVLGRDATIQAALLRARHVELCVERVLEFFL
jgi:hypothetical protein